MKEDADKIAKIIADTGTELRGNLFFEVAQELWRVDQNFTARLFQNIAADYGINPNVKPNETN